MSHKKGHVGWPRTNYRDLARKEFDQLTVVEDTERRASNGAVIWRYKCSCGELVEVISTNLASGNTGSCGCQQGKARG